VRPIFIAWIVNRSNACGGSALKVVRFPLRGVRTGLIMEDAANMLLSRRREDGGGYNSMEMSIIFLEKT
jgi:hypothetical protein